MQQGEDMRTTALTQACNSGSCPSVHHDDESGDVLVQGRAVTRIPGVDLGQGEAVVALPVALILEAADKIRGIAAGKS
jgi:hypothetical protein